MQFPLSGDAEKLDLTAGGEGLGTDHADNGGLARPVSPHQTVNLAFRQGQVYLVHHRHPAVALGEGTGDQYIF